MLEALRGIWVLLLVSQTKGKVGSCGSLRNQGDSPKAETSESHAWPSSRAQGLLTLGASPQHLGDVQSYPDSQRCRGDKLRARDMSKGQMGHKGQSHIQWLLFFKAPPQESGDCDYTRLFLPLV